MSQSKGYNSRAYMSPAPGAFAFVSATDFGATPPVAPVGTASGTSGSLATNAFTQVAWVTEHGVSLPSPEVETALSADTAVSIAQPAVPVNGATVLGWIIYEGATTGSEKALHAANQSTQAQMTFVTDHGTFIGFPLTTTTVVVLKVGTGAVPSAIDQSGIQPALPTIAPNSTADYYLVIPNAGSQWKVQKSVDYMRSDGTQETAGIVLSHFDCVQPLYPGLSAVVAAGTYIVINGYVFIAAVAGTTAAAFIGFSNFNTVEGANTIDGSVTWTSYGKAALVRVVFGNVTASAAIPVAQTYALFEH